MGKTQKQNNTFNFQVCFCVCVFKFKKIEIILYLAENKILTFSNRMRTLQLQDMHPENKANTNSLYLQPS